MSEQKTHDLHDFMQRLTDKMAENYRQIQKRATEDPGTAGDQGEENWADLLRGWLPRTYEVVTKGRIISQSGDVSPQVDVLVLKSIYPKRLIEEGQKIFLAAGVAAAFECKITLKAEHIEKTMTNCVTIKNLYPVRKGTPYKELHAPIVYGLLAHSHSWKAPNSTPEININKNLNESDYEHVSHPRECLDILCVSDFGTCVSGKITFIGPATLKDYRSLDPEIHDLYGKEGSAQSSYVMHTSSHSNQTVHFTPIGTLISYLSRRLAWEDPTLRDLVEYYRFIGIGGTGCGGFRQWPISIYSEDIQQSIQQCRIGLSPNLGKWDEWQVAYNLE